MACRGCACLLRWLMPRAPWPRLRRRVVGRQALAPCGGAARRCSTPCRARFGLVATWCAWPARFGTMRWCCSQMFDAASAFDQNLASWNTASASSMSYVRSAPIACMRAHYTTRRLEHSSTRAVMAVLNWMCALGPGLDGSSRLGLLLRWLMQLAPGMLRRCVVGRHALAHARVLLADVLPCIGLQPAHRRLEHSKRFHHVYGMLRATACMPGD